MWPGLRCHPAIVNQSRTFAPSGPSFPFASIPPATYFGHATRPKFPAGKSTDCPVPYFDHNATAPLHPAARAAWLDAADRLWHNPSGLHAAATRALASLEDCRERLADLLGCDDPRRIVFTSGATAANNLLARHLARTAATDAVAILSPLEHPAVHAAFGTNFSGRVVESDVDRDGVVPVDVVNATQDACAGRPVACVSVMAAGNESGVLQPWQAIAAACRLRRIPYHTDATQWLGKLPASGLGGCDWVTGSGHKFGGPRGVGFLVVPAEATFFGDVGGPQESGRLAGTENLPGIAGMVAALEARDRDASATATRGAGSRDAAIDFLRRQLPAAVVVSGGADRLWNTLAILIPGADSRKMVAALDRAGIEASTGSACSSGTASAAREVAATAGWFSFPPESTFGMVRFSAGPETTAAEWIAAVGALVAFVSSDSKAPRVALG